MPERGKVRAHLYKKGVGKRSQFGLSRGVKPRGNGDVVCLCGRRRGEKPIPPRRDGLPPGRKEPLRFFSRSPGKAPPPKGKYWRNVHKGTPFPKKKKPWPPLQKKKDF